MLGSYKRVYDVKCIGNFYVFLVITIRQIYSEELKYISRQRA